MKYRKFGKIGDVSPLGFGTMRLPMKGNAVDDDEAIRIVRHGIDGGINYIDTAYFYHNNYSEVLIGKALADGYRERVMLATKSPLGTVQTAEDFDRVFEEQLKKLNTDYIDCYLLHAVSGDKWDNIVMRHRLVDRMIKLRREGRVRHIGFSFHDNFDQFKRVVDEFEECEFCQIQLNYIGVNDQAGLSGLKYAADKGLGVIIMEPLLGGKLAGVSDDVREALGEEKEPVEWALDYLWNKEGVSVLLSGMSTMQQVQDNLVYAGRSGIGMLSAEEETRFRKAKVIYDSKTPIACTGCRYCIPCAMKIDIPEIFEVHNKGANESYNHVKNIYNEIEIGAGACISCGQCEEKCPQNLNISGLMAEIDERYGRKGKLI